jgi:hypothetical protein
MLIVAILSICFAFFLFSTRGTNANIRDLLFWISICLVTSSIVLLTSHSILMICSVLDGKSYVNYWSQIVMAYVVITAYILVKEIKVVACETISLDKENDL